MLRASIVRTCCALLLVSTGAAAAPTPIEAFARLPAIRQLSLSPDGKRIVYIASFLKNWDDREVALTLELASGSAATVVMASDPGRFDLSWCGWANNERLLCGVSAVVNEMSQIYPISRLVGVNADGSDQKVLLQNSTAGVAQFQDQILDWTPNEPDSVLIQLDTETNGYPSVYELDVHTGRKRLHTRGRAPIRRFTTDSRGAVRLGVGYAKGSAEIEYFARLEDDDDWRRLARIKAFGSSEALEPIAIAPGSNRAYAIGLYEGRDALWEIDLTDKVEPVLIFSHPLVDAASPQFTSDGRLLGVGYETDRPFVHYTDKLARAVINSVNNQEPAKFNMITDISRDEKLFVIRSASDVDAGTYYILNIETGSFARVASAYPELADAALGRMRSITYPAADGVEIPGYLTSPAGVRAESLPLIVMPHGGPISRDSWEFFFLREFLVHRGYAVLQMNFRGSSGYGSKWFHDAHQDWGGLTYSDIRDGARWAIAQGVADPQRVCIVGWSFGGYAALLGAVRDNALFKCSVSIAGVSDLPLLLRHSRAFINWRIAREQIGVDWDKLKLDSPLRHVENIDVPVLLLHGDHDYQVEIDHSRKMARALKRAKKPHRAVFIDDANHQLWRKSDRVTLLTEVEKFLGEHLGPGVTAEAE